jgi:predicted glutamine amidotransferase
MTRLFGCICNQPQRLDEALESVRTVLVAKAPVARWGLGYVHSGEVLLTLHPRQATTEVDFYALLAGLNSDYMIGWAGAEDELRGDANTQPFRYRRWFFAQENAGGPPTAAEHLHEIQGQLLQHIPDYLRRNIRGRSPAELVFHLFLSMLHDAGTLDDPNLAPTHIRRALRDTVALVDAVSGKAGTSWQHGNIVLSNSRSMMAVRLDEEPLQVRRLKQQKDPRRPESQFKAVLVVSSQDLRGESGFEELPPRSAVAISRDVTTDIVELDA